MGVMTEEAGANLGWEEQSSCYGTAPWSEQYRENEPNVQRMHSERGFLLSCFCFFELCSHQNSAPRGAVLTQDKTLPRESHESAESSVS